MSLENCSPSREFLSVTEKGHGLVSRQVMWRKMVHQIQDFSTQMKLACGRLRFLFGLKATEDSETFTTTACCDG